jgi:hypothetical protein
MTVLGILARGFTMKLIRVTATAVTVGLITAAVGRWFVDPCGGDTSAWLAFAVPVLAPPIAAWIFSLPHPRMLRYIDNGSIACIASLVGLAVGVDDHGEACGEELIPGVVVVWTLIQAAIGVGLGALLLSWWLRRNSTG